MSKLLTSSKCFICILIATFCFEMQNIFEHALRYFIIDSNYKLLITFEQVDVYLNEPIKIDELITLANQSNQQDKGTILIEAAKITTIKMKAKKISWSFKEKTKQKMIRKRHIKRGKTHCSNRFCRISQKTRRFR